MNERRHKLEELFQAALECSPQERPGFLDQECAGRPELRAELEDLLRAAVAAEKVFEPHEADQATQRRGHAETLTEDRIGAAVGRYKLLEKIGEGGMGVVYMAQQEEPVRRRVALKIIKLGMDTKSVVARFEAERQALALMDHPNIARVLDGGATETGRPYFVMELVQGVPITEFCDKNQLSTEQRLKLFIPVCQAIQSAHQKGIIHRDLKPTNILVTLNPDGTGMPMVIDFGVAKATNQKLTEKTLFTAHGMMIGTPAYMSPEQAEMSNLDVDTRADIYSLGALLYELLTGSPPFPEQRLRSAGYNEMQRIILQEQPLKPSTRLSTLQGEQRSIVARNRGASELTLGEAFPGDLDWIVMKCLEKDRSRRYETANGLANDLERHLHNEPVTARPPSRLYEFQKTARRHWVGFTAVAAVLAALAIGMTISALEAVRARRAEALAKQRLAESETISKFLAELFQSPNPSRDGRTVTVADSLAAAIKKIETDLANQPATRAKLQASIAWTYHTLGLNQEAIPLQEKVRDYYLTTFGLDRGETLWAMNNLAIFYREVGRFDEALKLKEQVLRLRRKMMGPEHPDTLQAMNNLANSYREAGRVDEALKLLEQALALRRKVSGAEHTETLLAMRNLANCYDMAGRRDEALKLRQQVLGLRRKISGPEHPETLAAMEGLAISYYNAGRLDEAIKLQEDHLVLSRKVLGPEHPYTLIAMYNLANSYYSTNRLDEALKLFEQVVSLRRKVLSPEHTETLQAMVNLAICYDGTGRHEEALKLLEQALTLRRKVNGPERPETLLVMHNLANSYEQAGRHDEALKLYEQVLALRRKVNGPERLETLYEMQGLALCYQEVGRLEEALKLNQQTLALSYKLLGPEHPDTLTSLNITAWLLATSPAPEIRNGTNAVQLAETAVAATRRLNPGFLDTLAAAYAETQQFDKAVAAQQEAIALLHIDQEKADLASRLKLYQANKPYRVQASP